MTGAWADSGKHAIATFAGGCFWCMEPPFDKLDGVISTTSGFTGGTVKNPSYKQVSRGGTGHFEAVNIEYDPVKISYEKLLEVFWRNIDPTDDKGQFCDKGAEYRAGIFYHNEEQRVLAEKSKQALVENWRFSEPIVTDIIAASAFYPAEEYHQDFYIKNSWQYKFYRNRCGRDRVLEKYWGE
jgi:peptide-methionine (S)-S-oxide reductase